MASKTRPGTSRSASTKIPADIKTFLDEGDMDSIELRCMEQLENAPGDLDFFIPVLRALVQRGKDHRADALFDLLVESLEGDEHTDTRRELFREVLVFWPEKRKARTRLLDMLRDDFGTSPGFDSLAEHCQVMKSPEPAKALAELESWLRYAEGNAVFMPTKGVGRITDVNTRLNKIRVAFQADGGEQMSFRVGEARRLLESLPPGHFLLDKLNDLPALQQLAKKDAGEILKRLFTSVGRPLSVAEIKEMLEGVVPGSRWSSWWGKAKEDPRLVVGSGTRPTITWTDTASDAEAALKEQFRKADPREKLAMARKHAGRSPDLDQAMAEALEEAATEIASSEPALAFELLLAIDNRFAAAAPARVAERLAASIGRDDIATLTSAIGDRALRRWATTAIRDNRRDWPSVYLRLLRTENDMQTLGVLFDALQKDTAELDTEAIIRSTLAHPAETPGLYLWLSRELTQREEFKPLMDLVYLKALVAALNDPAAREHHAAFRKLFDPGNAADMAARSLDLEGARQFLAALERDTGLEEYRKDQLHQDLHMWHPDLSQKEDDVFYVTAAALEAKREEFRTLIQKDLPHNAEEIKKAKEWGDLKENFEYHAARAKQELLSSRAKTLEEQLGKARALKPQTVNPAAVCVGTTVELSGAAAEVADTAVTVLGPWDSDPNRGILSYTAPAVAEILGKKVGDTIALNGKDYRIERITVWEE
jgi:transcription elongation GreA/GreB family factor